MIYLNKTIETQLNHRSIRQFKDTPIEPETLDTLFKVANRTASSNGLQTFSIIRVTDRKKRAQIADICTQDYVKDLPEFLVFIVDAFRNAQIASEMGVDSDSKGDMDRFFQGFTDGAIAAQNMYTAIESLGMGAVYFGSILNDPAKIIEILELPKLTFPIFGIGFGYPNQDPMLKPRMDLSLKLFDNKYKIQNNYLNLIKDYDEEMQTYYDLRKADKPLDAFSKQVASALQDSNEKRSSLLNIIRDQGFNLKV